MTRQRLRRRHPGSEPKDGSDVPDAPQPSAARPRQAGASQSYDFCTALDALRPARSCRSGATLKARSVRRYVVLESSADAPDAPTVAGFRGRPVASFDTVDLALQFARDALEHGRKIAVVDANKGRELPLSLLLPR